MFAGGLQQAWGGDVGGGYALRRLWREEDVSWAGNHTPGNEMTFLDIDDAIARGPALVGSPQQIIDKIMYFREAFGHDLQSFSLPTMIPHEQQMDMLERLAAEVIPVIRKQAPTTLWTDQDPYGGRPAFTGRTVPDAAAALTQARVSPGPLRDAGSE